MKAFERGKGTIVIKKNVDDYEGIRKRVSQLGRDLMSLRAACEDRNSEIFPQEVVMEILNRCKSVKEAADDIRIDESFIKEVKETKDVMRYFKAKIDKARSEEEVYTRKKECFNMFVSRLESAREQYFR